MKNYLFILLLLLIKAAAVAQQKNKSVAFTYAEFKGGYGINSFGKGLNEKYKEGNFSTSGGGLASLAAFRKFKKINYLNFGIKYKSLAAAPAKGDNSQELFFNYWGAAAAIKYFPFDKIARKGIYIQSDYFWLLNLLKNTALLQIFNLIISLLLAMALHLELVTILLLAIKKQC